MRIIKARIPKDCDIAFLGDDHKGLVSRCDQAVESAIAWIAAKKNRRFCHLGDATESRTIDHKFFDLDNTELSIPMLQVKAEAAQFKPIAPKCLAWLMGNHEWSVSKTLDMTAEILTKMKIPDRHGGLACKLLLSDEKTGETICKVYLQHKTRGRFVSQAKDHEQRVANIRASVKISLMHKACDCHLMVCGHAHQVVVVPPSHILGVKDDGEGLGQVYLDDLIPPSEAVYIDPNQRWYACSGSFLQTSVVGIDTYAERAGYDPVELGYVIAEIRDGVLSNLKPVYFKG